MNIQQDSNIPIYQQIADALEDMILEGHLLEEDQAPSTNQLAAHYNLNPATARKGLSILSDEGILYKKRGLGMFVQKGARDMIRQKRKKSFVEMYITTLLRESKRLGISLPELWQMIEHEEGRPKS